MPVKNTYSHNFGIQNLGRGWFQGSTAVGLSSNVTYEFWFKASGTRGFIASAVQTYADLVEDTWSAEGWYLSLESGILRLYNYSGDVLQSLNLGACTAGQWNHVALVKSSGTNLKAYINGSLTVDGAFGSRLYTSSYFHFNGYGLETWDGVDWYYDWVTEPDNTVTLLIDEARFWTEARSAAQLDSTRNKVSEAPFPAALMSYSSANGTTHAGHGTREVPPGANAPALSPDVPFPDGAPFIPFGDGSVIRAPIGAWVFDGSQWREIREAWVFDGVAWRKARGGTSLTANTQTTLRAYTAAGTTSIESFQSFEAWVKVDSVGSVELIYAWENGWQIRGLSNTQLSLLRRRGDGGADTAQFTVVAGAWNHIAVECHGTFLKLFVNGVQSGTDATYTFNSFSTFGGQDLRIYARPGFLIDEVRLFDFGRGNPSVANQRFLSNLNPQNAAMNHLFRMSDLVGSEKRIPSEGTFSGDYLRVANLGEVNNLVLAQDEPALTY
jgi:hypothetical protein